MFPLIRRRPERAVARRHADPFFALREEMEIGGPVRLRQVEEAQQRIVNIVRRLEDSEEIVVQRGGEDVLV